MFAIHCPTIGSRILVWRSSVTGLRNAARGLEIDYRCECGGSGTWLTGRYPPSEGLVRHDHPTRSAA